MRDRAFIANMDYSRGVSSRKGFGESRCPKGKRIEWLCRARYLHLDENSSTSFRADTGPHTLRTAQPPRWSLVGPRFSLSIDT